MTPTQELTNEHRVIERMLAVVWKAADGLERGEMVDKKIFEDAVDFFKNFADKCHHGKEEKLLFVRMKQRGMSDKTGPLAVMLAEHDEGRAHVRAIGENAGKVLSSKTQKDIVEHSRAYVQLLSAHIEKEDNILYPMANRILTNADQEDLTKGFEEIEEKVMGPGVHEKYHKIIEEWERKVG